MPALSQKRVTGLLVGKHDCDTSADPTSCETKIPPTGATAVKGTDALYSYYRPLATHATLVQSRREKQCDR